MSRIKTIIIFLKIAYFEVRKHHFYPWWVVIELVGIPFMVATVILTSESNRVLLVTFTEEDMNELGLSEKEKKWLE